MDILFSDHNAEQPVLTDGTGTHTASPSGDDPGIGLEAKKGTRKRKRNEAEWKRNKRKEKNNLGEEHISSRGKHIQAKVPKSQDCSKCRFKCTEKFSDEERKNLCSSYWNLKDYARKKGFILSQLNVTETSRERLKGQERKKNRELSIEYSFQKTNVKERVCKTFFMKTLCISWGPIHKALEGRDSSGAFVESDKRGKSESANKTDENIRKQIKEHIESFPSVQSHYTRKDSRRRYLAQSLTITKMYHLYKEKMQSQNLNAASEKVYRRIFCDEYNLAFFKPKKDQCATCCKYEALRGQEKEAFQNEYQEHLHRNKRAKEEKSNDRKRARTDETFTTCSFDLQSVLQLPHSNVSLMYYSRKLCFYNLCVWEGKEPFTGSCYCWTEIDGKRGSNEISTCILKWLLSLPQNITEISLYSDTCGGQNRNQNFSAMLKYFLSTQDHVTTITQNFLESGHTEMEVDSMHAAIEHEKKHTDVFCVTDWLGVFKRARRNVKSPYKIFKLKHTDFLDFQNTASSLLKNRKVDEAGNLVNWLKVKSFKHLKQEPDALYYKYDFDQPYLKIVVSAPRRRTYQNSVPQPAYKSPLPIGQAKKNDLLKLCRSNAIPEEFHHWYQSLPDSAAATNDRTMGACVEDSMSESEPDES